MEIEILENEIICKEIPEVKIEINVDNKQIIGIEEFFKMVVIKRELDFPTKEVSLTDGCVTFINDELGADILKLFEDLCSSINESMQTHTDIDE